jgi:DNA-binding MarR family transcriptional regulator
MEKINNLLEKYSIKKEKVQADFEFEDENKEEKIFQNAKPYFLMIPYELIKDDDLTYIDVLVYGSILFFAQMNNHRCFVSNRFLADFLSKENKKRNIGSISNSLSKLEIKGYIKRKINASNHREEIIPLVDIGFTKIENKNSDVKKFIDFYYDMAKRIRGIKLKITKADAGNIKRELKEINKDDLEKMAVYFLARMTKFSPGISTFLSAGIQNALRDKMRNKEDFWKEINSILEFYK